MSTPPALYQNRQNPYSVNTIWGIIMRQDCSAYAEEPLRTVGLLEAAHQYSLQDMCGSASTPIPTLLPTQE